jgi:acyl carrier protein
LDEQIKLHGFRIEPGEVEAVLGSHPAVAEVVVVAREDREGDRRLVAYLVACPGESEPPALELRAVAAKRLPGYMIPAQLVFLPALPRTSHGKIDRRALPAPPSTRPGDMPYRAPRRSVERAVAEIWQEVLGVDRVGVEDNFFDLGGRSLLLVRVHSRLKQRFQAEVSMIELFQHPTVASLAALIGGRSKRRPSKLSPAERATRQRAGREPVRAGVDGGN